MFLSKSNITNVETDKQLRRSFTNSTNKSQGYLQNIYISHGVSLLYT